MKAKWTNSVNITGKIFNLGSGFRELQVKVSGPNSKHPGTRFIQGEMNIAVDKDCNNIIPVNYQYVPEFWPAKDGGEPRENANFKALERIINEAMVCERVGVEEAAQVRISGDVASNDFWNADGELISAKQINGGFIHDAYGKVPERAATFKMDCVLTKCIEREFENDDSSVVILGGYTFNFRNDLVPFEVNVRSEGGKNYFLDQDISSKTPMVTTIEGDIVNATIKREIIKESAFGEPQVDVVETSHRSWDVVWAAPEPMEWDDDETITKNEMKQKIQDRENMLVEEKKKRDEYKANKTPNAFHESKSTVKPKAKVVIEDDDDDFDF